jgi:hypothetical protein
MQDSTTASLSCPADFTEVNFHDHKARSLLELKESLNDRKQENWDVSPTTKDTEF